MHKVNFYGGDLGSKGASIIGFPSSDTMSDFSVEGMQLSHLSAILQMKSQQVQQLEAEIRNLIKIQTEQAIQLKNTFNESFELQKQLAVSKKNASEAKAIQSDETLSAVPSRAGTAIGERDAIDDTAFLRCFITNDEKTMEKLIKKMLKISDPQQRGITMQSLFHQIQRFLEIYHTFEVLCNEYQKTSFIPTFEDRMKSMIDCKRILLWVRVPTANIFVSHTANLIVPVGKGLLSSVLKAQEKLIISDPTKDPSYSEQYDGQVLEFAKSVMLQPILDPKKEVLWIIELVDRIDAQGSVIPPKVDDILIVDYISMCMQRIYQGESSVDELIKKVLTDTTKSLLSERQVMPLLESVQLTISKIIGCEAIQIFFVDEAENCLFQLREAARRANPKDGDMNLSSVSKFKTAIDNCGIAGVAYKTGNTINISIAKEHNGFNMMMDGEYPNGSLLAVPLKNSKGNVTLVAVARQKRSGMMFTKTDEIMLEALSRVYSGALSNAQFHENNINNIQKAITNHKYYTALLAVAQELSAELDTNQLIRKIMTKAQSFIGADRCSLFMVDPIRGGLWSLVAHGENSKIFVPLGEGIAGTVAKTGETINIPDAYSDPRFNSAVDKKTGYVTKSILCVPIRNNDGSIMGCTQMINKLSGTEFTQTDVELMSAFNVFCGIALSNAQLYEQATISKKKMSAMLDIVLSMSSTQTLNQLVSSLSSKAKDLVESKYVFIFAIDKERHICHPIAINDKITFSTRHDIVGYVATSGIEINETEPNNDERFDNTFLSGIGIIPKSILAIPVTDSLNQVIGVLEAVDKQGAPKFTADDQLLFRNFATFAGLAMQRWMQKSPDDFWKPEADIVDTLTVVEQKSFQPPSRLMLTDPLLSIVSTIEFDSVAYTRTQQIRILMWFFHDLDLMKEFSIPLGTLIRFLTAVSDQYHYVPFHDFSHAVDVTQFIYMLIKIGKLNTTFTKLELLALLVAAICHDMGNQGKITKHQEKMGTPLSLLFKDQPIMETFHCQSAIHTVGKPGCNILSSLSPTQIHDFWVLVIESILATEEGQSRKIIDDIEDSMGNEEVMSFDNSQQRARLMKLILKIGDICNTARPYDQMRVWSTVLADDIIPDQDEPDSKQETARSRINSTQNTSRREEHKTMEAAKEKVEYFKILAEPLFQTLSKAVPLLKPIEAKFQQNIDLIALHIQQNIENLSY